MLIIDVMIDASNFAAFSDKLMSVINGLMNDIINNTHTVVASINIITSCGSHFFTSNILSFNRLYI